MTDVTPVQHTRDGRGLDARNCLTPRHVGSFWSKVDKRGPDDCWPWLAALAVNGYGVFGIAQKRDGRWGNQQFKAHRIVWSLTNGYIKPQLVIRHSCDKPSCCNPRHLLIGTGNDNVADKVSRNRQSRGPAHSAIMQLVIARGEQSGMARLTDVLVRAIRSDHDAGLSTQEIADRYEVSLPTAYRVSRRRSWRHVS